ncbi:MAG: hypothetical protein ABI113_16700 [Mucilaginibacter sp.]
MLTAAVTVFSSSTNQVTATLLRNTPYSWYVVSKSTTTTVTAQSDTWKFYLAGAGVTSYSPFPATITAPIFGLNLSAGTTAVNLTGQAAMLTMTLPLTMFISVPHPICPCLKAA